jgi:hypothetical protein
MDFSAPPSQAFQEHAHNGLRQSRAKSAEFLFPLVPRSAVCTLVRDARTDGQYSLQSVFIYIQMSKNFPVVWRHGQRPLHPVCGVPHGDLALRDRRSPGSKRNLFVKRCEPVEHVFPIGKFSVRSRQMGGVQRERQTMEKSTGKPSEQAPVQVSQQQGVQNVAAALAATFWAS